MDEQLFKKEKKVIVATENKNLGEKICGTLDDMGWHIQQKSSLIDVIEKIRLNIIDIIFLEQGFGSSGDNNDPLIKEIRSLPPSMRRKLIVVLLGDQWQSQDKKMAFSLSVDLVINSKDIDRLREIISMKLLEYSTSYNVFDKCLQSQQAEKV